MSRWKMMFIASILLVMGLYNYQIFKKEETLKNGELVFLELAPVDPRSLLQGDYMELRYAMASGSWDSIPQLQTPFDSLPTRGFIIFKLDDKRVARGIRFQKNTENLKQGEYAIKYFKKDWQIHIGVESYFFQEGKGYALDSARYGGVRLDKHGNSLLVGMYDRKLQLIDLSKVKPIIKDYQNTVPLIKEPQKKEVD
jgi:uncharacterized membrane-anchored protein